MRIIALAETGSTNDAVLEAARAGAEDGLWIRADVQTGGRGRQGRSWQSISGNLFASTLVRPHAQERRTEQLSFVAAIALDEALRAWVPRSRLAIKWPNDLMLDGAKVSGILLEASEGSVVVGFGVNLRARPDLDRPTTSLVDAGIDAPTPAQLLDVLAGRFEAVRADWRANGFVAIRDAWLARAAGLGASLRVEIGGETVAGRFEDIAADGALVLQLGDGSRRQLHSGDVFGLKD